MTALELQSNGLTGCTLAEATELLAPLSHSLSALRLGGNKLGGELPANVAVFSLLVSLDLSGLGLTGPLPVWLGELERLERADLSGNDLSGEIPEDMSPKTRCERVGSMIGTWLVRTGPTPAPAALTF